MAFDPNLNTGACRNPMNNETNSTEFSDWYQNEESFDLSTFISNNGNLELCNDDLFQNLFPSNSAPGDERLKKGHADQVADQVYDREVEHWHHNVTTGDPYSACTSACSSAAPSPVPLSLYNTPPVTPQSERHRNISPHHLQFEGLTATMSSSRFSSLREEGTSNFAPVRQLPLETCGLADNSQVVIKQEPETEQQPVLYPTQINVKSEHSEALHRPLVCNLSAEKGGNQLKRPSATATETTAKKSKALLKGSMEYMQKRQRNNVAVRRSRDKAKQKAIETQRKVDELSNENDRLHARVAELTHELGTLKNLLKSLPHVAT